MGVGPQQCITVVQDDRKGESNLIMTFRIPNRYVYYPRMLPSLSYLLGSNPSHAAGGLTHCLGYPLVKGCAPGGSLHCTRVLGPYTALDSLQHFSLCKRTHWHRHAPSHAPRDGLGREASWIDLNSRVPAEAGRQLGAAPAAFRIVCNIRPWPGHLMLKRPGPAR